jgi:outer membrane protein TolC
VYYTIIYLEKAIAVQDSVITVLELNRRQMEDKYKNGEALKLDVLTMQNNIDIEQNRKEDLNNQLQKQLNLLAYATGSAPLPVNGDLSFDPVMVSDTGALHAAQSGNMEYTMAKQRILQAETDLSLTRLGNRPTLNLNGSTGFRNGFQPDIAAFKFNYAIGVAISVPIYSGGRVRKQVQIAEMAIRQNQLALESLDNEYRKNIAQALTDVRSNQERLTTVNEQVSIAKEALRVAQSRYTNGISTNIELLNANTNLQKVELARIQYQYQLALAEIELARLMGVRYW